jgi:hypothetical protein
MLSLILFAQSQISRCDVEFVKSLAAKGTAGGVGHRQPVFAVELTFRAIANDPPASAVRNPHESFSIQRESVGYSALGSRLHKGSAICDGSGFGRIVVRVNAIAKRVDEIHDGSIGTPADPVGNGNVFVHQLTRITALNAIQLTIGPLGIGFVQCAHPKPALAIRSGIIETNARTAGQWIAKRLKRSALHVPICNSPGGSRNESAGLPDAQRHDWHARFKHFDASRLGRESEDLILPDEVHPVQETFLRVPDGAFPNHIMNFENMFDFGHGLFPYYLKAIARTAVNNSVDIKQSQDESAGERI